MLKGGGEEEVGECDRRREERNAITDQRDQRDNLGIGGRALQRAVCCSTLVEGAESYKQLLVAQPSNPLAVQPLQSRAIKYRAGLLYMFKVEALL